MSRHPQGVTPYISQNMDFGHTRAVVRDILYVPSAAECAQLKREYEARILAKEARKAEKRSLKEQKQQAKEAARMAKTAVVKDLSDSSDDDSDIKHSNTDTASVFSFRSFTSHASFLPRRGHDKMDKAR